MPQMAAKNNKDNIQMDQRGVIGGCGLDSSGSRERSVAGSCAHGTEPFRSTYTKCGEFLDIISK